MEMSWITVENALVLGQDVEQAQVMKVVDCRGVCSGEVQLALKDGWLIVKSETIKDRELTVYAAEDFEIQDGQVVFSVEETDSGMAPAIINGRNGYEPAPQLRCTGETTYVFRNEPKVKKISVARVRDRRRGVAYFDLQRLGIDHPEKGFRLELALENHAPHRWPFTLFGSQAPEEMCHMFVKVLEENASCR